MFCQVNTVPLSNIPGFQALLSASEMLSTSFPLISGSLIHYAHAIVNYLRATIPSNPDTDATIYQLSVACLNAPHASPKQLEQFGDSLLTGADGPASNSLFELAYLSYAATTLYVPLSERISTKIRKAQTKMAGGSIAPNVLLTSSQANVQFPQNLSNTVPIYTPSQSHTEISPPQIDAPSNLFVSAPPPVTHSSENQFDLPPFFQQGGLDLNLNEQQKKILQLIELARSEFKSGSKDVSFNAMLAAIKELEKCN